MIYKAYATNGTGKYRTFHKDDALRLGDAAMLPLNPKQLTVAYALSKQTLADEMTFFDRYNQMNMSEFHEFLARCAAQLYVEKTSMAKKIEGVLGYLLPLVKMEFIPAGLNENIDSDSDYDDDWVDDIIQREAK